MVALAVASLVALGAAACGGGGHSAPASTQRAQPSLSKMAAALGGVPAAERTAMLGTMRLLRSVKLKHCLGAAERLRLGAALNRIMGPLGRSEPILLGCAVPQRETG